MPLTTLRNHRLPSKLTGFRTLNSSIQSAVELRINTLTKMNGYPTPAHVLRRIYDYLDLSSVFKLQEGILKLRDITKYAAEVLSTIPQTKMQRFQLDRTPITAYIEDNKVAYGYKNLTTLDIDLVTFLVTSSEMVEASWALDFSTEQDSNLVIQFARLYRTLVGPSTFSKSKPSKMNEDVYSADSAGDSVASMYSSTSDKIEILTNLPTIKLALKAVKGDTKAGSKIIKDEDTVCRLSHIRLVDHILSLYTNIDTWNLFVPSRLKDDQPATEERIAGLKLLSGYLHSLLLIPHFMRLELFKLTYINMEKWLGNFPTIPADVLANYELTIAKYDVFSVAEDVAALVALHQDSNDEVLDADIHVFFNEFTNTFGLDDILKDADLIAIDNSEVALTELTMLKQDKYNYIMLSHPIGKYEMSYDLLRNIQDKEIFRQSMNDAMLAIVPLVGRYLQDSLITDLKNHNFSPMIPYHVALPMSHSVDKSSLPSIHNGSYNHRNHAIAGTYANEFILRHDKLYTVFNARSIARDMAPLCAIDYDMARDFRDMIGKQWRSLYPANIVSGDRSYEPAIFGSSNIELRQIVETISGMHFEMISRSLVAPAIREIWATVFSSFAVMYVQQTDMGDGGIDVKQLSLVEGFGSPYGMTYEALNSLQKFNDKDIVKLTDRIYLGFLKVFPLPSDEVGVSRFSLRRPYYHCLANGAKSTVTKFCFGEGLLQFHLRPIAKTDDSPLVLFDKTYGYINNTLVLQSDISLRLNSEPGDRYTVALPIEKANWNNDRLEPLVHFMKIKHYGKATVRSEAIAEEITEMGQIISEIEVELQRSDNEAVVKTETETKPDLGINLQGVKKKKDHKEEEDKESKDNKD